MIGPAPTREEEIQAKYADFSARFSNTLLERLIANNSDGDNIALSPSRLQTVLMLLANWGSPQLQRKILDVVGTEAMTIQEANVLCDREWLRIEPWRDGDSEDVAIIDINTIMWIKKGLEINASALENVKKEYAVKTESIDFRKPDAKSVIDDVIYRVSRGLIKGIDAEIDKETQALLTDILYFYAKWNEQFDEEETKNQKFYGLHGESLVPMMTRTDSMDYQETDIFQMVQLQYRCYCENKRAFSMRIYLPKEGYTTSDILKEQVRERLSIDTDEQEVELTLPKFSVTSNVKMKDVLKEIGLQEIFDSWDIIPKFSKNLKIADVIQQVKVKVSETDTEAAALTYIPMIAGCAPDMKPEPVVMNVNRPFIFEIAEDYNNTILFTGVINNVVEEESDNDSNELRQNFKETLIAESSLEFAIVGIKPTCKDSFDMVMNSINEGNQLYLMPEPDNAYDHNAIAVYKGQQKIGYVKAKETFGIVDYLRKDDYTECYVVHKYQSTLIAEIKK